MPGWPIRFQDANFEHRFVWCNSKLEGRSLRWKPFGMPRLNPNFPTKVFFLYGISPKTGEREGPLGTGFFVGLPSNVGLGYYRHAYAITAQHVAARGASIIRVNTRDGDSRFVEFEPHEWHFDPKGDDIAAIDVTDRLRSLTDDYSFVPNSMFATKEFMQEVQFGIGEDGFMLGLFANQHGKKRNLVAARFGNVSLLADDDEPLKQPNKNRRPSHLFDMHSRTGFSGSPVFAYRTPSGDLRYNVDRGEYRKLRQKLLLGDMLEESEATENTFLVLLGVHVGQYHDEVSVKKAQSAWPETQAIHEGDSLTIPNSLSLVVPAWRIAELLNSPSLVQQREAREEMDRKEERKENPAKGEAISSDQSAESAALTGAPNPSHKADFNRLLNEAARKREQEG